MLAHYIKKHFEDASIKVVTFGRGGENDYIWDISKGFTPPKDAPKLDALINTAAVFRAGDDMMFVNINGALRAYDVCKMIDCAHFIQISSTSASDEQRSLTPNDAYGMSKREADEALLARSYQDDYPLLTIMRPSQIVDAFGLAEKNQPFFYHVLRLAKAGEPVQVFGSMDKARNYLFIDDVVEAIASCIQHKYGGIKNIINPESHSIVKLVETVSAHFGQSQDIQWLTDRDGPMECGFPDPDIFKDDGGHVLKPLCLGDIVARMQYPAQALKPA